ncbi:MAG TPA: transcriptional regulator [Phycisphaerales bacterium]|nr:transcriptional regulator [Phycisphaerales bacterium]
MAEIETGKASSGRGKRKKAGSRAVEIPATKRGGNRETSIIAGRVARLIKLMKILEDAPKRIGSEALAKNMGISRRTLFRDLGTLKAAGFKRSSLLQTGKSRPQKEKKRGVALEHSEMIGLLLIGKILKGIPDQPMFTSAMQGIEKVVAELPAETRRIYRELMEQVSVSPGAINISHDDERRYRLLSLCIEERQVCNALYDGVEPYGRTSTRIHPLHLHFHNRAWYVMAYSESHEEVRTFKLSRFIDLERTRRHFPPLKFSLKDYLDDAWGIIPGEKKYDIVLRFSPKVSRNVSEVIWHRTQATHPLSNGGCEMRLRVSGLHEIRWWILGYGNECEVMEPADLRDEIARLASATAKRYAGHLNGNGHGHGSGK